jgi:hypothetical protein
VFSGPMIYSSTLFKYLQTPNVHVAGNTRACCNALNAGGYAAFLSTVMRRGNIVRAASKALQYGQPSTQVAA